MKKFKFILSTVLLSLFIVYLTRAQTNVSGGIYSNTIWMAANSPYIVVDTVVVFPGVTLTIEPGVTVKFENDKRLEIRQAKLIAIGTITDSITFTSNSSSAIPGIWSEIYLNGGVHNSKLNYCNFRYSDRGINGGNVYDTLSIYNSDFSDNNNGISGGTLIIDSCRFIRTTYIGINMVFGRINNSTFLHNYIGIHGGSSLTAFYGYTYITNCILDSNQIGVSDISYAILDNCIISYNQFGTLDNSFFLGDIHGSNCIKNSIIDSNTVIGLCLGLGDSVLNCQIKHNGIGLSDSVVNLSTSGANFISGNNIENNAIGIKLWVSNNIISCNKICNNTTYDLYYNSNFNDTIANNYWCIADSATLSIKVYDGYDNINLGLVNFLPLDTLQCYLSTEASHPSPQKFSFNLFPNPAFDNITIVLPKVAPKTEVKIYNLLGDIKYIAPIKEQKTIINIEDLTTGIYLIEITSENTISRQKIVKQ